MRTFARPNKPNDIRRRHSEVYCAVPPVACGALHRSSARLDIPHEILGKTFKASVDILAIID